MSDHADFGEFYQDVEAWTKAIGDARAMKAMALARKLLGLIREKGYEAETVIDAIDLARRVATKGSD